MKITPDNFVVADNCALILPLHRDLDGLRERAAGIWRFNARLTGQKPADGVRYATGLRNAVAIEWNRTANALFVVLHGRDQLNTLWPELFTAEDNAETVAEEMHRIQEGGDYGWPYAYFDVRRGMRMLAPEYGGDGRTPDRKAWRRRTTLDRRKPSR